MKKPQRPVANRTADGQLACAYGEAWLGRHEKCAAEVAKACGVPIEDVVVADYSHLTPK